MSGPASDFCLTAQPLWVWRTVPARSLQSYNCNSNPHKQSYQPWHVLKGRVSSFYRVFFTFKLRFFFCACWKRQRQTYKGMNASDRHVNCYSRASKACCNARNWERRCKRVQTNSSITCGSLCFFVFFCNFSVVVRFCGNFSQFPLFELGGNGRQALPDKSFSVGHVEECSMRTFYM